MADTTISFLSTSAPTMPSGTTLVKGEWTYTTSGLRSNGINHSQKTSGYIKFDAVVGTVTVAISVSSEKSYDYMSVHLSKTTDVPERGGGNVANISGEIVNTTYTYNITEAGTYYLHFFYACDSSGYSGSDCGWLRVVTLPLKTGGIYTNVNGVWKQGSQYTNVSGVWKQGATYTNVNGVWKQGQ